MPDDEAARIWGGARDPHWSPGGTVAEAGVQELEINKSGVGNPIKTASNNYSAGRHEPINLFEQMAMHQVKSNPLDGAKKLPFEIGDTRWPTSEGWIKMQSVIKNTDGPKTTIHFVYNEVIGTFDDFKFK